MTDKTENNYEVGYRRPPVATRYPKGKSGNPKGRPKAAEFNPGSARWEGTLQAQLTLRGVTKPLDLPFELHIDGAKATVSGRASLDRLAFGVGQGEWAATDDIPGKVAVRVQLRAVRDER